MSDTLLHKKIKTLVKREEFIDALELLENLETPSFFSLKYLSLLYRYYGQIEKEISLYEKHKKIVIKDEYLTTRGKELDRTQVELLVPRKILNTTDKNSVPIRSNIISEGKLCFVVPSNDEYYSLLIECLSSILGCEEFKECPIFIANCGLSQASTIVLEKINKRITVIEVNKVLSKHHIYLNNEKQYMSALLFRGFFDELFGDFDFCFYLDSDSWIQDQSCLFDYVNLADNQGIALSKHPFNVRVSESNHWLNRNTLTPSQKKIIIGFPAIINCCICVRIKSKEYKDYKKTLIENVTKLGPNWGVDQEVFLYVAAKYKLELLPNEYAYEGVLNLKIEKDGSHILYSKTNRIIKIFHLGGGLMFKNRKWDYFTDANYSSNRKVKMQLRTSTHFLVPEWKDRNRIVKELAKLDKFNLFE